MRLFVLAVVLGLGCVSTDSSRDPETELRKAQERLEQELALRLLSGADSDVTGDDARSYVGIGGADFLPLKSAPRPGAESGVLRSHETHTAMSARKRPVVFRRAQALPH